VHSHEVASHFWALNVLAPGIVGVAGGTLSQESNSEHRERNVNVSRRQHVGCAPSFITGTDDHCSFVLHISIAR